MSDFSFPQFRRYTNGHSWFCFLKADVWKELRVMGSRYSVSEHRALQYPEKVWVLEMLEGREGVEVISQQEYEAFLLECALTRVLSDF